MSAKEGPRAAGIEARLLPSRRPDGAARWGGLEEAAA